MNSRKKNGSIQFSDFLRHRANLFGLYAKFFCRITNYAFYSPKGSFWEKFLFELCASQSRISIDNRWGPVAKNFSVGLWIQNFQIIPFQKKNLLECLSFFFGLWAVTSQILTKQKWLGCRNFPLRFQRFLREKNCLTRKNFSLQFLTLS